MISEGLGTLLRYKSPQSKIKIGDRLIVFLWKKESPTQEWETAATDSWEPIQHLDQVMKAIDTLNSVKKIGN